MLRVAFALAITIAAGLLIIILVLKQGFSDSQHAAQQRYDLSHFAELSALNSKQLTNFARQYVATLDPKYKQQYSTLVAQITGDAPWDDGKRLSYVDRLKEYNVDSQDLNTLAKSSELSMKLVQTEIRAFDMVATLIGTSPSSLTSQQHATWIAALTLLTNDEYVNETIKIMAPVDDFISSINNKSTQLVEVNSNYINKLSFASLFLVILIISVLILCYLQLEKRVISTTAYLVNEANKIAEGDLTRVINYTGNDEIANLSASFNTMVERLLSLLTQIKKQSDQAQSSATELDEISHKAKLLNDQQSQAIEVISSSVYENSTAVKEVSQNCNDAANSANDADERTQQGITVVHQGIKSVEDVARILSESIVHLTDLEKSVSEVTAILNVISNIAEQTNLLALNAAIEAARAGEQGRGFAVVADEVRTLASRTQKSTIEIKDKIESLQSASNAVTNRIRSSDESVKHAVANSEQVGTMLEEISMQVKRISDLNRTIASASEEQSQVTEDIAERLTSIQNDSLESQGQTEQISSSSKELAQIAASLNVQINKFKLS